MFGKKYSDIINDKCGQKDIRILILKKDNEVLGVCYFEADDKLFPISLQVFVKEKYRQQGFGKFLLQEMCLREKNKNLILGVENKIKNKLLKDEILTSCNLKFL